MTSDPAGTDLDRAVKRAYTLLELGRSAEAEAYIAPLLVADPTGRHGLLLLTFRFMLEERNDEAAAAALRLLAAHPDDVDGLLALAKIRHDQGRDGEAEPVARQAARIDPDNSLGLVTLGRILAAVPGKLPEALAIADRVIELFPDDAEGYRARAEYLTRQQQWAEGETWAIEALARDPEDAGTRLLLGLDRAMLGRSEQAQRDVATALSAGPTPSQLRAVARAVEAVGIPEHLAPVYRAALIALDRPDLSLPGAAGEESELLAAQAALAHQMLEDSRPDPHGRARPRAGELADAVLAVEADNPLARGVRAEVLRYDGRPEEALAVVERLIAEGHESVDLYRLAVYCLHDLDRGAEALAVAARALERHPRSTVLYCEQARLLRLRSRAKEGVAAALRGTQIDPAFRGLQHELGRCAEDAGDVELAERAFRTAESQYPYEPPVLASLAHLLATQDRWSEAEPLLERLAPHADAEPGPCLQIFAASVQQVGQTLHAVAEGRTDMDEVAARGQRALDLVGLLLRDHPEAVRTAEEGVRALADQFGHLLSSALTPPPEDDPFVRVTRRAQAMAAAAQTREG